ncbi:cation diffusion facilitator family transporter, putative [Babesia ovis]|uniref:Cation diffusion facilitator family transporter, putative n=1 Tax=Babesia ovis TaxID=5869 RepID=A0A9W5WVK6_BABOV|nr:cation diffusion facilitator family transporter, putative [Babesia ovis]
MEECQQPEIDDISLYENAPSDEVPVSYTDMPLFHKMSQTQKVVIIILVRLQLINPRWSYLRNNYMVHYRNVLYQSRSDRRYAYIKLFRHLELLYRRTETPESLRSGNDVLDSARWITALLAEAFVELEMIRNERDASYTPMTVDDIIGGIQINSPSDLRLHIDAICEHLKFFQRANRSPPNLDIYRNATARYERMASVAEIPTQWLAFYSVKINL